jgi:hypothetical protein
MSDENYFDALPSLKNRSLRFGWALIILPIAVVTAIVASPAFNEFRAQNQFDRKTSCSDKADSTITFFNINFGRRNGSVRGAFDVASGLVTATTNFDGKGDQNIKGRLTPWYTSPIKPIKHYKLVITAGSGEHATEVVSAINACVNRPQYQITKLSLTGSIKPLAAIIG